MKVGKIPKFSPDQTRRLQNKDYIGHNVSKYENNWLDSKKESRDDVQQVYKKVSRKAISAF